MSIHPVKNAQFFLSFLLVSAALISGCETKEDPLANGELDPENTWISITSGVKGMESEWLLITPDGEEMRGKGGLQLTNPPEGDYWILWEPVSGFNSPVNNPQRLLYQKGAREIFIADYEELTGGQGILVVQSDIADSRVRWNLHGPDGFFAAGEGSRVMNGRGEGSYQVVWGEVDGYETPSETVGDLDPSTTLTLQSHYSEIEEPTGSIFVDVAPAGQPFPWVLRSASGGSWPGAGDHQFDGLPLDDYTIEWGAVEGWVTPQPATAVLTETEPLSFLGLYLEPETPTGTLVINVEPDYLNARWQLASTEGWGGNGFGDQTIEGLPVGPYAVLWSDIDGYQTPQVVEKTLAAGETLEFDGVYTVLEVPTGTVIIDPDPDALHAPWTMESDAGGFFSGAGDSTLAELPLGTYTLTWGDVDGFTPPTPNPVTQVLGAGAVAVFAIE